MKFARVALPMTAIALVVALNQTGVPRRSSVLGTKIRRCTGVPTGPRSIRSDTLGVSVKGGKLGPALAPAVKVTPGSQAVATDPVVMSVGFRSAGPRRVTAIVSLTNHADCPAAVSVGRIGARLGSSRSTSGAVLFGDRDRVVVPAGRTISGRAEFPVEADGTWRVEGTATAELGVDE